MMSASLQYCGQNNRQLLIRGAGASSVFVIESAVSSQVSSNPHTREFLLYNKLCLREDNTGDSGDEDEDL